MDLEVRGDRDRALAAYRRADDRGDGKGALCLGALLARRGDTAGARAAYRRAAARGEPTAASNLGVLLEEAGDLPGAEAAYREADERGEASGAFNLGCLLSEMGDEAGAVAALRRADERGDAAGASNLGVLLERQGDLDGALSAYRRADERGDANGSFNLGVLLAGRGDLDGARAAYRRAAERGDAAMQERVAHTDANPTLADLRPRVRSFGVLPGGSMRRARSAGVGARGGESRKFRRSPSSAVWAARPSELAVLAQAALEAADASASPTSIKAPATQTATKQQFVALRTAQLPSGNTFRRRRLVAAVLVLLVCVIAAGVALATLRNHPAPTLRASIRHTAGATHVKAGAKHALTAKPTHHATLPRKRAVRHAATKHASHHAAAPVVAQAPATPPSSDAASAAPPSNNLAQTPNVGSGTPRTSSGAPVAGTQPKATSPAVTSPTRHHSRTGTGTVSGGG